MNVSQNRGTLGSQGMYAGYRGIMGIIFRDCAGDIFRNVHFREGFSGPTGIDGIYRGM